MLPLPLGFLRVVADDVASPPLPVPDHDFLHPPVLGDDLIATGPAEHVAANLASGTKWSCCM